MIVSFKSCKKIVLGLSVMMLVGCQSTPMPSIQNSKKSPATEKPDLKPSSGVILRPYEREEIQRKEMQVVIPEQRTKQQFEDGRQLPAFKKLMQNTQLAYKQGKWNAAEAYALQAQRLAPQSAETFLYLALVADKKNKLENAKALAQRGLSYAQSHAMKKQLWLIILKTAKQKNDQKTIQQAQQALKHL